MRSRRASLWLLASTLLTASVSRAEPGTQSALAIGGLSGSVAGDYFSSNHNLDDRRHFPGLNLALKQRLRLPAGVRWVAEARVLAQQVGHDDDDATGWSPRAVRYAGEVTSELREGYLEVARERWELRIGHQIITWGRADELNPTDVITPKDFLLLLPEGSPAYRFGVTALKLDYFLPRGLRLSGVWVPAFTPSLIPYADPPPGIRLRQRLPAATVANGAAGLKLDRSGETLDASLSYFYGFNLFPELHVANNTTDSETGAVRATIDALYKRQHMIGADFATVRGRFGYRGEVAYVYTDNPDGRDVQSIVPYLYYVLGIERTLFNDLSVIVQYVGRWVPDRVDPARALDDPDPVQGRLRFVAARETFLINQQLDTVQNGWSARIAKRFWNDTLDCELLTLHYLERNDFFLKPRLSYALTDAWTATVGGEIFGGPRYSFLGRLKKNTGAFTELRYSF